MASRSSSISTEARLRLAALALLVAAGCSRSLELIPVTGIVTLDGKPVEDAAVLFMPMAGGPAASGTTDAQGRFQLSSVNQSGVVPGEHQVTITKQTMLGITPDGLPDAGGIRIQWHVPEKYSRPETSGLKANVDPSQGEFRFSLSSS